MFHSPPHNISAILLKANILAGGIKGKRTSIRAEPLPPIPPERDRRTFDMPLVSKLWEIITSFRPKYYDIRHSRFYLKYLTSSEFQPDEDYNGYIPVTNLETPSPSIRMQTGFTFPRRKFAGQLSPRLSILPPTNTLKTNRKLATSKGLEDGHMMGSGNKNLQQTSGTTKMHRSQKQFLNVG